MRILQIFAVLALLLLMATWLYAAGPAQAPQDSGVASYRLRYRGVEETKALLDALFPGEYTLLADTALNTLHLRATPEQWNRLRAWLETADQPSPLRPVTMTVDVLQADFSAAANDLANLAPAARALLDTTLQFRHYTRLSRMELHGAELQRLGVATVDHQLSLVPARLEADAGPCHVELRELHLQQRVGMGQVEFTTTLQATPDQWTLLGSSSLDQPEQALVVLLHVHLD